MKIIKDIKDSTREWFLKRAHKKVARNKKLLGYSQVKNLGILYDASEEHNYRHIVQLVKKLQDDQKKVKTMGFVNQKKRPDYCFPQLVYDFCDAKSFAWNQKPTAQNVKDFIDAEYDLLIDLTPSDFHLVKYLCAISKARMKTGRYVEKYIDIYDLMLQVDDNNSIEETSSQVIHYLKMINNGPASKE
ncbi:MAG: DUF6913 domain-containing protein [Bacteroidota bacterium]